MKFAQEFDGYRCQGILCNANSWFKAGHCTSTESCFVCKGNQFGISQIIFAETGLWQMPFPSTEPAMALPSRPACSPQVVLSGPSLHTQLLAACRGLKKHTNCFEGICSPGATALQSMTLRNSGKTCGHTSYKREV